MTNYFKMPPIDREVKEPKKTVFNKGLDIDMTVKECGMGPENFDNVLLIGQSTYFGYVFKAWDNGREDKFCIYFGTAGDEFK